MPKIFFVSFSSGPPSFLFHFHPTPILLSFCMQSSGKNHYWRKSLAGWLKGRDKKRGRPFSGLKSANETHFPELYQLVHCITTTTTITTPNFSFFFPLLGTPPPLQRLVLDSIAWNKFASSSCPCTYYRVVQRIQENLKYRNLFSLFLVCPSQKNRLSS